MRVLITGGSGLIGNHLRPLLNSKGMESIVLSRSSRDPDSYQWDPGNGIIDPLALRDTDTIVHLAGASISGWWTKSYKQQLIDSRVKTARLLFEKVKRS